MTVVTGVSPMTMCSTLCIVPGGGYDSMGRTFARMLRTLNVNDGAAHRGAETSSMSMSDSWR